MLSTWAKIKRKLLRYFSRSIFFTTLPLDVGGRSFKVPFVDGVHCDVSELWMLDLQSRLLVRKAGAFIDIGMNLGQTLVVMKALDSSRVYIGFEPNPNCFSYCEKLVSLNNLSGVSMVPVGISSTNGIVSLQIYSDDNFDSSASIVSNFRPDPIKAVKFVPVFSFADIARSLGIKDIGLIKIDVEGAELDVLQSMEAAIHEARPWILIEILPCYSADNTGRIYRQESIEAMLRRLDYSILRIIKSSQNRLSHLEEIEQIGIHKELGLSDFVLCPREDVSRVLSSVTDDQIY